MNYGDKSYRKGDGDMTWPDVAGFAPRKCARSPWLLHARFYPGAGRKLRGIFTAGSDSERAPGPHFVRFPAAIWALLIPAVSEPFRRLQPPTI